MALSRIVSDDRSLAIDHLQRAVEIAATVVSRYYYMTKGMFIQCLFLFLMQIPHSISNKLLKIRIPFICELRCDFIVMLILSVLYSRGA